MLSSITPLGERSRRQHWGVTVGFFAVAAALAGAAVGAALGAVGGLLPGGAVAHALVLAGLVLLGLALDLGLGGLRLPTHLRQVDERWLHRYRGWVYGAGFGAQLGTGVATIVTTSAVYATLAAELLAGSAWGGAAIGAVFGAARGAVVLAGARLTTPERLRSFHRRLMELDPSFRRGALGAQAAVALLALAVLR